MLHLQPKEKLQQRNQQLTPLQRKHKKKLLLDAKNWLAKKRSSKLKSLPNKKINSK
jgi:hypothetical protein